MKQSFARLAESLAVPWGGGSREGAVQGTARSTRSQGLGSIATERRRGLRGAALAALLCALPTFARAQSFDDFESIGRLEDRRAQPSDLSVGGHSFPPSIVYKLFGVVTPHVFAAARLGWTDNYLLQDPTAPGVTLRREAYGAVSAGVRLDTELYDHRLEVGYRAAALELVKSGSGDTLAQEARVRLDLYGNRVEAHADAAWRRDAYPQSIQLTGIVVLDRLEVSGYVEGKAGAFGARAGGGVERYDYRRKALNDLDALGYGADVQLYWRLRPRLRALVEYNWKQWTYRRGGRGSLNDYQVHAAVVGADGELTAKLSASLKVGWSLQDARRGPNPDRRDLQSLVVRASARWEPLERTSLVLAYRREIAPSTNSNGLRSDGVTLEVEQGITGELAVRAAVGYTHAVASPGEHLNRLQARASLHYALREWISVVGSYRFVKLTSGFPDSDYAAHEVALSVGFGL
ncbi:MAG: hypothetical protein D6731_08350 [Planctomycetota bacterium]|nr:MAG: hypothetical protein D6731_08350 [Planctomycetota bacterium]